MLSPQSQSKQVFQGEWSVVSDGKNTDKDFVS